ncbi:MAG: shikimate kinase [Paludibacteraceae bacterium]|nr:shikimate kinase [Paludibacteraceae bacterium]
MFFLIGYMASGKSTLARMAAKTMHLPCADTDQLVEQQCAMTCAQIIERHGETFFREQERKIIDKLIAAETNTIAATGGGLPCYSKNIELMNSHGTTVYLQWSPEQLVERLYLSGISHRPLVAHFGNDRKAMLNFVTRHLKQREPFYLQAKHVLKCDSLDDYQILNLFLKTINY